MMYIGKLARLSGATPKAIRLYEARGLLSAPMRRGKYRVYSDADIVLVHMIRRGQAVGFALDEMKDLISLRRKTGCFPLRLARTLIHGRRKRLRTEMDRLAMLDRDLVDLEEEISRTFGESSE